MEKYLFFLLSIQLCFSLDFIPPTLPVPGGSGYNAPCKSCRAMVESFTKGMKKTEKLKYGGGNTAWEEANLRTYKRSEVRFVEIHDSVCHEVSTSQDHCFHLAEEHEHLLKEWFTDIHDPNDLDKSDLYSWLCIENMKVCCSAGHYGPDCKPCKGLENKDEQSVTICNDHGSCKGDGTRKGDGTCKCWRGYLGEFCENCDNGYYKEKMENGSTSCLPCDKSCGQNGCTGSGSKSCKDCKVGWIYLGEDNGCTDVNECLEEPEISDGVIKGICEVNEFCVNTPGSYSCLKCDPACRACSGDGADMCLGCAKGYTFDSTQKKCIALVDNEIVNDVEKEVEVSDEQRKLEL
ncbi:cysteine-rich with EGF-like domain protein 2 isoform X2 [Adelges cooleyi]|uniref:cysteine-rich with EGF-like domain protein 2 isoform X2 n=1 Tax=Adelges cooleyi TaxID=133065 RepID=UPI00218019BF|nr:cysteine-rich with EGF-like domain protein 2 isoform X2 [Adelges cooleyi]